MDEDHDRLIRLEAENKALTQRLAEHELRDAEWKAQETARTDQMWSAFGVGKFLLPTLLALQPVIIVGGTWLIRELS